MSLLRSSGAESFDEVDPATHEIDPARTAAIAARIKVGKVLVAAE